MKRGILLVANYISQDMCANLIYSIRESGCKLPIRIIHFGGKKIENEYILKEAELLFFENFPAEAKEFILELKAILTDCPIGFIYRFLAWYMDWDQFIYSDNDIVAISNWENLFEYIEDNDILHADCEYQLHGKYSYRKSEGMVEHFGENVFDKALNAGHFLINKKDKQLADLKAASLWMKSHADIPIMHDQALVHIASVVGGWSDKNLCKPGSDWVNPAATRHKNTLSLIQSLSRQGGKMSHLHYAGWTPKGDRSIEEILYSNVDDAQRIQQLTTVGIKKMLFYYKYKRAVKALKRKMRK